MAEFKKEFNCSCLKTHNAMLDEYIAEKGAILKVADYVKKYGCKKAFILADENTYKAAGESVCKVLSDNEIEFSKYIYKTGALLEPDEYAVGSAVMHYDYTCDIIIGVGSGVINDIGKILSKTANRPYIIVATAPSMDGYASASSSVLVDGFKISLSTKCANVVIGDINVLKEAPERMIVSGLGDMLAKYISICEWRIGNLVTGEYYCEEIAQYVRAALKKCTDNAQKLLKRDEDAVKAVFEGLVISGVAMNYALLSRPASGVEHYYSHIWDMRGLEFGTKTDFHGIQCAIGTLYAAKIYDRIKKITPNREKAVKYVESFNYDLHSAKLKEFLGKSALPMIELEKKEKKYDVKNHGDRLNAIIDNWDKILEIIEEEVPSSDKIAEILDSINAPKTAKEIGIDEAIVPMTFKATKDIRNKYILSQLCWDLGIIDEVEF